jgi:coproporphyrinogen III oxidase
MEISQKQQLASSWFKDLRDKIVAEFEKIEEEYFVLAQKTGTLLNYDQPAKFAKKLWQRHDIEDADGGGGEMSSLKGNVFEKVGVNISTVYGKFSEEFRHQIPGANQNPNFFATGISLVAHMQSPLVPAVHMNTRFVNTTKDWFGGGADLNPMFENDLDTKDFHQAFEDACNKHNPDYYPKFKKECDEYFVIKHRGEPRGVGGVFFDYLNNNNFEDDFLFVKDIGLAFLKIFPILVRRNMYKSWNDSQRNHQLIKRGRYTEFNLVYDRGTKFGLMTGGNPDAILMSLPPIAKWD